VKEGGRESGEGKGRGGWGRVGVVCGGEKGECGGGMVWGVVEGGEKG